MSDEIGRAALVTGGAGFLGAHVVAQLREAGVPVRVLALPGEPTADVEGDGVEIVRGDIRSRHDCERAVAGMDTVFHVAAMYSGWVTDPEAMYRTNVGGTFHVLEAARREGVGKIIVTASVVAIGRPTEGSIGDETTHYDGWALDFPYGRSKHLAMQLALDVAAWGTDVRVVCPAVVVGPGDRTPTPSGRLVLALARGKAPGYTAGGASYVDVRDAAAGHLAAARHGKPGETYVLAGHDLDNASLVRTIATAAGRRPILLPVPGSVALAYAAVLEAIATRTGTIPDVTRTFLRYGSRRAFFSGAKATRELGVAYRPLAETITDALTWFRARDML